MDLDKDLNNVKYKSKKKVKKECLHEFESVYYGSEWAVECKKCGKDIYDTHQKKDANKVINEQILKRKKI